MYCSHGRQKYPMRSSTCLNVVNLRIRDKILWSLEIIRIPETLVARIATTATSKPATRKNSSPSASYLPPVPAIKYLTTRSEGDTVREPDIAGLTAEVSP